MKYIFLGRPDKIFPDLVTGDKYVLTVMSKKDDAGVYITEPFTCPYIDWADFFDNWLPVKK